MQLSDECKTRLFRLALRTPAGDVAFVMADSREAAWRMGKTILAVLQSQPLYDIELDSVHAYDDLVQQGVSEDEDLRVFELARAQAKVTAWVHTPYFLTNDASLLGKWAELCAELAASVARSAIDRAK
jgi:hypothetical protein